MCLSFQAGKAHLSCAVNIAIYWPLLLYHIDTYVLSYYLMNATNFEKKYIYSEYKILVLIFYTTVIFIQLRSKYSQVKTQLILCNSFIDTNLIHNFLYKLHKIKFLYMFWASSAHLQEVNDVNCTCMQPLVFSFCAGGCLVHLLRGDCSLPLASAQDGHLQRMRIPEAAYMYN